jgi:REP element-mobilizing transposase RayT
MARRARSDGPGAWHHVVNRGVARRSVFETRADVRYFLSRLAREVRRGDLEIHAYSLLTNHFHLLVRSPTGRLSRAMQRVEDAYARWFNRRRGRDGHLFRARFASRPIESSSYWECVLLYIDLNPVEARLCAAPWHYPYGSAWHYLRKKGPPWLRRDVVEEWAGRTTGAASFWDPACYLRASGESWTEGRRWIVARRSAGSRALGPDPLDNLLKAAPPRVQAWLEERARCADGRPQERILVAPITLERAIQARIAGDPDRASRHGTRRWPLWEVLRTGCLREFCGLRIQELEVVTATSRGTVQARLSQHRERMLCDRRYASEAAAVLADALAFDHGGERGATRRPPRLGTATGANASPDGGHAPSGPGPCDPSSPLPARIP